MTSRAKAQSQSPRDTIPRLQQIVPHMRDQLMSLRTSSTFEHARRCYALTVDRLVSQGLGRRTASRVGDRDRYWSPTREVLDEAMRLGFVERQQLPSSRKYVDAHRDRVHNLTELGRQAAEEAEADMPAFCDRLAAAVYSNHPYFRSFINSLRIGPIGCPEVAEGEVEQSRKSHLGTDHWVELAFERIQRQEAQASDKARIRDAIVSVVRHRFGQTPERTPTSKQMAEALNDAYIEAALSLRGLSIGAIDLKIMKTWGSQLMLLDQSRYVPAHPGQNTIWLAADVNDNGGIVLKRKTLADHERPLVEAVIAAYKSQASAEKTSLKAPYLPIYRVRAQAAFNGLVPRRAPSSIWSSSDWPRTPTRSHASKYGSTSAPRDNQIRSRFTGAAETADTKSPCSHDHKEISMPRDALDHMAEAWNLDDYPFPAEAIHATNTPYCPTIFDEESQEFRRKLIRGSVRGSVNVGFLWSQGAQADTGFGKTTLMREITKEVNRDLGVDTLTRAGLRPDRQALIAAAYSNLNNLNAAGLYPVLFNAVLDLAEPMPDNEAVFDQVRARIIEELGTDDVSQIFRCVTDTWLHICGTAPPLRSEVVSAFANGGAQGVKAALGTVSATARLRNGLHYLDFALAVLSAAGVNHLYLMIDQLEDLATTRTITAAKRSREIGRIRDMLEGPPYVNRVHFILTFHNRAAQVLERFWEENRLPPFEALPSNTASVVVLRGLRDDDQVAALLRVYLEEQRQSAVEDDLLPFEAGAITVLREVSDGRVGILLNRAKELFNFAAERGDPRITGDLASRFFAGADTSDLEPRPDDDSGTPDNDIDDLLLGAR